MRYLQYRGGEAMEKRITVAPLMGLPVVKGLVVDMEGFGKHRSVMPFFVSDTPPPDRERLQGQAERARYDDTTKCLLGAACTTSYPSFWAQSCRVGRAATVNAHVFIFASRDPAADELLELLADGDGIRRRRMTFSCVDACPRGINITRAILEVSRAVVERTV